MIKEMREGFYELIETKDGVKILFLDKDIFAWIKTPNIGQILVWSNKNPATGSYLSKGRYTLYRVEDEPYLHDLEHLELEYGKDQWQGYFLLTGLPNQDRKRVRIIPTSEIITGKLDVSNLQHKYKSTMPDLLFLHDLTARERWQ